ncbi:MAG TPA: ACP S-malonyltransferase [Solirubrobacteraceae bacterium]|nr:ACP S-malonyltransferase [Solirubrobacteraceae bacterium]
MASNAPTAVLFPGQGSHEEGMRDTVAAHAPDLLERCLELVGEDPFPRAADSTRFAQPAIFCASVARWRAASLSDPPVAVAGHSLGEFSALVAAGALDASEGLELVVERGRLMAEAGEHAGGGAMLAVLGGDDEAVHALAAKYDVTVANENAPGQLVLSGPTEALDAVTEEAQADGMRAMELGVAGAFHSPIVAPAEPAFREALEKATFREPQIQVISGMTAEPMTDPVDDLAGALTRPVRWKDTMQALDALGAKRFLDAGPGQVLAKLVRRNLPDAEGGSLDLSETASA